MLPAACNPNGIDARQISILPIPAFLFQDACGRIPNPMDDAPGGHVVTHDDERRTAFVDLELAAVWRGRERGVVTDDEIYQRLDELERLLWRRVFGRLRQVAPGSRAYVGFPTSPAGGPG